jgi:hypothetical protein
MSDTEETSAAQEMNTVLTARRPLSYKDLERTVFLYTLKFLMFSWSFVSTVSSFVGTVGKGVVRSLQPETYVFFEGSTHPYSLRDLNLRAPGVAPIAWYYDAKKHEFLSSRLFENSSHYHTHHLDYLASEIKYNDLVLYDISDFIDSVRWAGEEQETAPSAECLLAAWSLDSGVVLQKTQSLFLSVINGEGNTVRISLGQN